MKRGGHTVARAKPIRVGCAGWSIASKVAGCFATEGSHLERYAQVFSCVEINSSFYRSHQPKTYERWARSVPETFRFSVKLPRSITHELRLQSCEARLRAFLDEVASLGDKLGYILVQLPPSLVLDRQKASGFFKLLRGHAAAPVACEPRHASWFTAQGVSVLEEAGVAPVWADPPPVTDARVPYDGIAPYVRLHGSPQIYYSAYDDAFIETVAGRLRQAQRQYGDVWCIFDNTARGEAVPNAMTLMKHLAP